MAASFRLETLVFAPIALVFDLARDLDFHQRAFGHTGERIVGGRAGGRIELGEEVEWEARHFGLRMRLRTRITAMDAPHRFVDEQVRGPFASMVHVHTFQAVERGTLMIDEWTHTSPLGPLGWVVDRLVLGWYMRRLIERRNVGLALAAAAEVAEPED